MEEKRKHYSPKFKQKATELCSVRGSVKNVDRELGSRAEMIYHQRREFKNDPSLSFSGNGNKQLTPDAKELARIKKGTCPWNGIY